MHLLGYTCACMSNSRYVTLHHHSPHWLLMWYHTHPHKILRNSVATLSCLSQCLRRQFLSTLLRLRGSLTLQNSLFVRCNVNAKLDAILAHIQNFQESKARADTGREKMRDGKRSLSGKGAGKICIFQNRAGIEMRDSHVLAFSSAPIAERYTAGSFKGVGFILPMLLIEVQINEMLRVSRLAEILTDFTRICLCRAVSTASAIKMFPLVQARDPKPLGPSFPLWEHFAARTQADAYQISECLSNLPKF